MDALPAVQSFEQGRVASRALSKSLNFQYSRRG
jgi:hypothetical protein